jgi:hypothetical protein
LFPLLAELALLSPVNPWDKKDGMEGRMSHDPNSEHVTHKVQVARDGKPYTGTYIIDGEVIIVQFGGRDKVEPLSGVEPESKARMMLGEMIAAHPAGKDAALDASLNPPGRVMKDVQRPINRDWIVAEPQDDELFDLEEDERQLLQCLGAAVLLQWNTLSNDMHRSIFETTIAVMESDHSDNLRHQLALFLHDHKDDRTH